MPESPEEVETGNNEGNHPNDTHPLTEHIADVSMDKDTDNGNEHEPEGGTDVVELSILNEEEVDSDGNHNCNSDKETEENHTESLAGVFVDLAGDTGGRSEDGEEKNTSEEGIVEELVPALRDGNRRVMLINEVSDDCGNNDSHEKEEAAKIIL